MMVMPVRSAWAQMSAKNSRPQVSVTYPGDTDETVRRRANWIESARKEGKLEWWGILKTADAVKIIAEFNKVYPFITVAFWSGRGEEIAAKLEADVAGSRFTVDIASGGEPYNYPRWRKMGIMEQYTDIIPGVKKMDKRTLSKYDDWAIPGNNATAPAYNTKIVSAAEAPKRWEDLLDPRWKGQIALTADTKLWAVLALEEGGWGLEKTEDFLNKIKQQKIIWAASFAAGHTLLTSGEYKILGQSYVYNTLKAQDKGAPVEWSRVNPVIVTGPSVTLRKGAPDPNAARLFLEWMFSPQGLLIYDKITSQGVALHGSGTRLAKALDGLKIVYRTEEGTIKAATMGLREKYAKILGVTPD
jgi:iron(III) transport system substrate-binding protein